MKKLLFTLLVVAVALVPVLADAYGGSSADPKKSPGASSPSGGTPSGAGTSPSPSASPSTSPAASPSTSGDFSQYKSQLECEKAGGQWRAASNLCEKK